MLVMRTADTPSDIFTQRARLIRRGDTYAQVDVSAAGANLTPPRRWTSARTKECRIRARSGRGAVARTGRLLLRIGPSGVGTRWYSGYQVGAPGANLYPVSSCWVHTNS